MLNSKLFQVSSLLSATLFASTAFAFSLAGLSNQEATSGLKAALQKGSVAAVAKLGVENGFLYNDRVKIELPGILQQAQPLLKMTGRGAQLDELVLSMNRAAEKAVPLAKPLLLDAVKSMSVTMRRTFSAAATRRSRIFSGRKPAGRWPSNSCRSSNRLPTGRDLRRLTTRRWRRSQCSISCRSSRQRLNDM